MPGLDLIKFPNLEMLHFGRETEGKMGQQMGARDEGGSQDGSMMDPCVKS